MTFKKSCGVLATCLAATSVVFGGELKEQLLQSGVDKIVFAARPYQQDGHWYANFGYYNDSTNRVTYGVGAPGRLSVFSVSEGSVKDLIFDEKGAVRDPQLSYDGTKILFSYRKGGTPHFHLYEIQVDGSGLKQLTFGDYDDIEPTYLPEGGIMFVSGRAQRWVNCWSTQVGTLHRCNEDGTGIELISPNVEHDNSPWPLPDGRMIYTRWEYVDRSQLKYHHLWITNPDGTQQMVYFGNQNPGCLYIDAKPLPGSSDEVMCIRAPGHGAREHGGDVVVLSNRNGPDDLGIVKTIAVPPDPETNQYSLLKQWYRDPYPITKDLFIVSRLNKLMVMDMNGNGEELFSLPEKEYLNEPRPVIARQRERLRPSTVDNSLETGKLILMNAAMGRNMEGVKPGEIKNLLVMETLPKPINHTGSMEPMSYGGTFTLERVVGKIPVEADGSAFMELPAKRSLFFIALDENDRAIKRMQSFLTVMPGEVTSCLGCHENRTETPDSNSFRNLMALNRAASKIEPIQGVPEIFDYPRDIQPILDKHCISCHNPQKQEGGVQLTGDLGPMYSHSYYWLSVKNQFGDNRNRAQSNYAPYQLGDAASGLMKKIDGGHGGVKMSDEEIKMIRYWLHAGAPYLGSYAGLGTGMIGQDLRSHEIDRADLKLPSVPAYQDALQRRCGECHQSSIAKAKPNYDFWPLKLLRGKHEKSKRPLPNSASDVMMNAEAVRYNAPCIPFTRHATFNLTRPAYSKLLMAPLAKDAGGWATADQKTHPVVFKDTNDADYQSMLKMITETSELLHTKYPNWTMANFEPHPGYIREMIRYGVLPATFDYKTGGMDVREIDAKYFDSQHHKPVQ